MLTTNITNAQVDVIINTYYNEYILNFNIHLKLYENQKTQKLSFIKCITIRFMKCFNQFNEIVLSLQYLQHCGDKYNNYYLDIKQIK